MIQPDKIVRSARKTLSVSVDAVGRVTVRAPKGCSKERIFSFLQSKEQWILRYKQVGAHNATRLPPADLDGYSLLLLGKAHTLALTDGTGISYTSARIEVPKKNAQAKLKQWLKTNAQRIFKTVTERTAEVMCVHYKSVEVGSARSKWGSCSYDNVIRYSFRLLYAPKEVIEYVAVHELAHVRHKNHSSAFWREVEKYSPDYKKYRKWLKDNAILMQIF